MKEKILYWLEPFLRLPVMGLDISDSSIKYIKFSTGGGIKIDFWGDTKIPLGIIVDGEIKEEDKLVAILRELHSSMGRTLRSSFAAVSLPEEKSFWRVVQLPKMKHEDVRNAIRWELEANIPLPVEDLIFDYEVIEPPKNHLDHMDIAVAAFPKETVDSYVRALRQADFTPYALELESQAIARAIISNLDSGTATLIVDFGKLRTSFVIVAGGSIVYTATIDLGGNILEAHIAKDLGVSEEKAVSIKKEVGLNIRALEGKVYSALLPSIASLVGELKRVIEYYERHREHFHGASSHVDEVLLTGGDANLLGLDTYLAANLAIPVRRADPWVAVKTRLRYPIPPITSNLALGYTTAIGLALRGVR